jgi:N-acyl homoserine lactone hydrolase
MRLAILDFGLFEVYQNGRMIGVPGYLIDAGSRKILVDTGFHADYLSDPVGISAADQMATFGRLIHYTARNTPTSQLALLGVSKVEITDLVLTHSHIDHVGRIGEFPHARLWITANERALPRPSYWAGKSRIPAWPNMQTTIITNPAELIQGVSLIPTPGHTLGHMSLLVSLTNTGKVLLTADAISRPDELVEDVWSDAEDPTLARQSAKALVDLAQREHAWLIYGHCPKQWLELRKAPHWYD